MSILDSQQNITIQLACLCQQVKAQVQIPRSKFPLQAYLCHCNICRHVSGLLCTTLCDLPARSLSLGVEGNTCTYSRIFVFCEQCGASIYRKSNDSLTIKLHTGVLELDDAAIEFSGQCCTDQTKDGGLSAWLDFSDSGKKDHCMAHEQPTVLQLEDQEGYDSTLDIMASCHCGGVQFAITPSSEASFEIFSPYPDLIVAFHSGSIQNEEGAKWWLRANGTRYLAGTCACKSCRLASGNDIQTWAFIPKVNIKQMNGSPLEFDMGTLKQYSSSDGVYRNFCGVCGATVFWHNEGRPDLIDVSVGLLKAASGARAEELLEWTTTRVSFQEDAQNRALITRIGNGLKKWGAREG